MPPTAKKSSPVKYTDKSAGQPELVSLFDALKERLSKWVQGNYIVKEDEAGRYSVYYNQEVELGGKKYPDLCFAYLLIQKSYVGFYFFPIYPMPSLKEKLPSELLKLLKGKTCFHIKRESPVLFDQIDQALEVGYHAFKSKGWK